MRSAPMGRGMRRVVAGLWVVIAIVQLSDTGFAHNLAPGIAWAVVGVAFGLTAARLAEALVRRAGVGGEHDATRKVRLLALGVWLGVYGGLVVALLVLSGIHVPGLMATDAYVVTMLLSADVATWVPTASRPDLAAP